MAWKNWQKTVATGLGICLWAGLTALMFCVPCRADDNNTITIANGEWAPYTSKALPHFGTVCRIITEAFALEGVRVTYVWTPWKRAFEETKAGAYDATSGWISTPSRRLHFLYSDVLFVTKKVFFHLKDYPFKWETIDDLKGLRIGAVNGYAYGESFDNAAANESIAVERVVDERTNFEKLLRGRIHIYPQELEVGLAHLENLSDEDRARITYHPRPLSELEYFLLFSIKVPKNRELVKKFNRGLRTLKANGKYRQYWGEVSKDME